MEILVVILILAVVAAIAGAAVGGRAVASAKRETVKSDLRQIVAAINLYRNDADEGLPASWVDIGYYGVNRKDKWGPNLPPRDLRYDKPPSYDVSYHTRECTAPPKASPAVNVWRQIRAQYEATPQLNPWDVERDEAVRFEPLCEPNSFGEHRITIRQGGVLRTFPVGHVKSLSINLTGGLSSRWSPDWVWEVSLGDKK